MSPARPERAARHLRGADMLPEGARAHQTHAGCSLAVAGHLTTHDDLRCGDDFKCP